MSDSHVSSADLTPGGAPVQQLPGGVLIERSAATVGIRLSRAEVRNAQSFATWQSLIDAADSLTAADRVVVISAEGRDFSAGLDLRMLRPGGLPGEGDLAELQALDEAALERRLAHYQQAFTRWAELDQIVVCVVRGHAIGAGFQLALAADLIIAADQATFTVGETEVGLVPDLGGTGALLRRAGQARTLELCLTGRRLPAHEALAWGVVNTVVPDGELEQTVTALSARLLSLPAPTLTAVKRLIRDRHDDRATAERAAQIPLLRGLGR